MADVKGSHALLIYGGIVIAFLGIGFMIAAGIYTGVTRKTDGWFWALLIVGIVLTVIGVLALIIGYVMHRRSHMMSVTY